MKLLVVGGAGYVGTILRPALEAHHEVRYFDRLPVRGAEERTLVADVNDGDAINRAVEDMEAVLYLAMGVVGKKNVSEVNPAFDVNVRGMYRFLHAATDEGIRRFVYASTLSVYNNYSRYKPLTEEVPANSWDVYGASKRLGETLCEMAHQQYPDGVFTILRLMLPRNEQDFVGYEFDPANPEKCSTALGPEDTRSLFIAAVACSNPGLHIVQATGDLMQKQFNLTRARVILGWQPKGK